MEFQGVNHMRETTSSVPVEPLMLFENISDAGSEDGQSLGVLQQVATFAQRRLATLETLYGKKVTDKGIAEENDDRWEDEIKVALSYTRAREEVLRDEDKYGIEEMKLFVMRYKSKHRRAKCTLILQAWFRMLPRRIRFLRVRRRRQKRLQAHFTAWIFFLKSIKIMRFSVRRRYIYLWREQADEILEARRIVLKMGQAGHQNVLAKLQLKGDALISNLAKQSQRKITPPQDLSPEQQQHRHTSRPTKSTVEAEREQLILRQMQVISEMKQKIGVFNGWKLFMKDIATNRATASMHIVRASRLGKVATKSKSMWLTERLETTFVMWRRWARYKTCKRRGEPVPEFAENIPRWNEWLKQKLRMEAVKSQAAIIGPIVCRRRYFTKMKQFVKDQKQQRDFLETATAQYNSNRLYYVMKHWFSYARRRGGIIRFQRNVLLAWYDWAVRKKKLRIIKQYLSVSLRTSTRRSILQLWRKRRADAQTVRAFQTDRLLNKNTQSYSQALLAIYIWIGDSPHASFLRAWQGWKLYCKRRRSWHYVKFCFQRTSARHKQRVYFRAWKGVLQNKGNYVNGRRKRTVVEILHGEHCSNRDIFDANDFSEAIIEGEAPSHQWLVEDERDMVEMKQWLERGIDKDGCTKVGGYTTDLHISADEGNIERTKELLRRFQPAEEAHKEHELDIQKRQMQKQMRKSMVSEEEAAPTMTKDSSSSITSMATTTKPRVIVEHCAEKYLVELRKLSEYSDYMIDVRNDNGETPLHLASCHLDDKYLEIVILLVQAGASVYSRDLAGLTPSDVAINPKIAEFLRRHKDRIHNYKFTSGERKIYRQIKLESSWGHMTWLPFMQMVVEVATNGASKRRHRKNGISLPTSVDNLDATHQEIIKKRMEVRTKRMTRDQELLSRAQVREDLIEFKKKHGIVKFSIEQDLFRDCKQTVQEELPLCFRSDGTKIVVARDDSQSQVVIPQKVLFNMPRTLHSITTDQFPGKRSGGRRFHAFFHHHYYIPAVLDQYDSNFSTYPGDKERAVAIERTNEVLAMKDYEKQVAALEEVKKLWNDAFLGHKDLVVRLDRLGATLNQKTIFYNKQVLNCKKEIEQHESKLRDLRRSRKTTARTINSSRNRNASQALNIDKELADLREQHVKSEAKLKSVESDIRTMISKKDTKNLRFRSLKEEMLHVHHSIQQSEEQIVQLEKQKLLVTGEYSEAFNKQMKNMKIISTEQSIAEDRIRELSCELNIKKRLGSYFQSVARQMRPVWERIQENLEEEKAKRMEPFKPFVREPKEDENDVFVGELLQDTDTPPFLQEGEETENNDVIVSDEVDTPKLEDEEGYTLDEDEEEKDMDALEEEPEETNTDVVVEEDAAGEVGQDSDSLHGEETNDDDGDAGDYGESQDEEDEEDDSCSGSSHESDLDETKYLSDDDQELPSPEENVPVGPKSGNGRRISRAEVLQAVNQGNRRQKKRENLNEDPILQLAKPLADDGEEAKRIRRQTRMEENRVSRRFSRRTSIGIVRSKGEKLGPKSQVVVDREESKRRMTVMYDQSRRLLFHGEVVLEEKKYEIKKRETMGCDHGISEEEARRKGDALREQLAARKAQAEFDKRMEIEKLLASKRGQAALLDGALTKMEATEETGDVLTVTRTPLKSSNLLARREEALEAVEDVNATDPDYFFANFLAIDDDEGTEKEEKVQDTTEPESTSVVDNTTPCPGVNPPVLWHGYSTTSKEECGVGSSVSVKRYKSFTSEAILQFNKKEGDDLFIKMAKENTFVEWKTPISEAELAEYSDISDVEIGEGNQHDNESLSSSSSSVSSCYPTNEQEECEDPLDQSFLPSISCDGDGDGDEGIAVGCDVEGGPRELRIIEISKQSETQSEEVFEKYQSGDWVAIANEEIDDESATLEQKVERQILKSKELVDASIWQAAPTELLPTDQQFRFSSSRRTPCRESHIRETLSREGISSGGSLNRSSIASRGSMKREGRGSKRKETGCFLFESSGSEGEDEVELVDGGDESLPPIRYSKSSKSSRVKPPQSFLQELEETNRQSPRKSSSAHGKKKARPEKERNASLELYVGSKLNESKSEADVPLFSDVARPVRTPSRRTRDDRKRRTKLEPLVKAPKTSAPSKLLVSSSSTPLLQKNARPAKGTTPFRGLSFFQSHQQKSPVSDDITHVFGKGLNSTNLVGSFGPTPPAPINLDGGDSGILKDAYALLNPVVKMHEK